MSELDALFNGKEPRQDKSCLVCGEPRTVQVAVRIARLTDRGLVAKGQSVTKSATLCDEHGLAAYKIGCDAIGRKAAV